MGLLRRISFLLPMLVATSVQGADVIEGSIYIDFEDGSDGDNVTATIIGNAAVDDGISVTYSTGTSDDVSSTGSQSATKIETDSSFDVDWLFDIGGTQYSGNTGSRGIRTTGGGSNGYFRVNFGSTQYPVSAGFHFKITAGSTWAQWDMVGWYQYFQLFAPKPDGNLKVIAHWAYSGQSSQSVALTSGHWYWVTMKRETDGNVFTINVYDTDDMSLVTSRTGTVEEDPNGGADIFAMGSIKYGSFHSGHTLDFDNLVINTDGTFPLLPVTLASGNYWVSPTGTASWAAAQSETPLSGTACASMATMNSNVGAGDVVYLRSGTYSTQLDPTGTSPANEGERVTISSYNGETVTISGLNDYGIDLTGWDYVTLDDIDVTNCEAYLLLNGSDHNIIQNCNWYLAQNVAGEWVNGVRITGSSQYNQFIDCSITDVGDSSTGDDLGGIITMGSSTSSTDESTHNLFLRCVLARGGHQVVTSYSGFNRWQDCHFYNDPWMDDGGTDYGNRNILFDGRGTSFNTLNIVDNCTFWRAARPVDAPGVSSFSIRSPGNIVRRSRFVDGADSGINVTTYSEHTSYSPNGYADDNHIYNNTIVYNGINTGNADADQIAGLTLFKSGGTTVADNRIKNNILWDNVDNRAFGDEPDTLIALNTFAGNREETTDPLFVSWSTGDLAPSDPDAHDFNLSSGSTSIDAGVFLTTISTSTGSGTSFVVADAGYFTDGEGIYAGDTIQLEGSETVLTISDVNYSTNTITFSPSTSWTSGDGVALPYYGDAPDQGAFESNFEPSISNPRNHTGPTGANSSIGIGMGGNSLTGGYSIP